jgi:hypothetical protein
VGLLHFTRLEGGIGRESEEKPKGEDFGARAGGLGGVNRQMVEDCAVYLKDCAG